MANIFNFPSKKRQPPGKAFEPDASELVQFDAPGRDTTSPAEASVLPVQHSGKDWSNQDLASIYRVKRLLDAAGVPNYVERSLSDEGDPWCIFCTETGDVFIHLCRIDGYYVLDSPNLQEAIRGVDFNGLIARFSEGALRSTEKDIKARKRLINLERGSKLYLHPSVLLAALIWSIYLESEDIVLFMPDEEDEFKNEVAIALVDAAADTEGAAADVHFIQAVATQHQLLSTKMPETGDDVSSARSTQFHKDIAVKGMALVPSAVAVGLSSIAISYGFLSERYFDDEPRIKSDADLSMPEELDAQVAASIPEAHPPRAQQSFDFIAILDKVFDHTMPEYLITDRPSLLENSAKIDTSYILDIVLASPKTGTSVSGFGDKQASSDTTIEKSIGELILPQLSLNDGKISEKTDISKSPAETSEPLIAMLFPVQPGPLSIAALRDTFSERLTEFTLGDIQIKATFDIVSFVEDTSPIFSASFSLETDDINITEPDLTDQLLGDAEDALVGFFQRPDSPNLIDGNAISFIFHLMGKERDVQIIAHDDEIVLIDFAAFSAQKSDLLSMSWDLEHGGTVQTIGLKVDFMAFDLIA